MNKSLPPIYKNGWWILVPNFQKLIWFLYDDPSYVDAIMSSTTFSNIAFSISMQISNFVCSKATFHSWAEANKSECKRWTILFSVMESWLHIHNFSQIYFQISPSPNIAFTSTPFSSFFLHSSITSCVQSIRSCFFCPNALLFISYWSQGLSSRDCRKP